MISILDFGVAGNIRSVANALGRVGAEYEIVGALPQKTGGLIIPGVGAFAAVGSMKKALKGSNPSQLPCPVLGICIGMQALFDKSEEDGTTAGLGVLAGKVRRLSGGVPLPQLGWNQVKIERKDPLLEGIGDGSYFYYANSYAGFPENIGCVLATTAYGEVFPCAIRKGNSWGVQFHPEKSGKAGQKLLGNFVSICKGWKA